MCSAAPPCFPQAVECQSPLIWSLSAARSFLQFVHNIYLFFLIKNSTPLLIKRSRRYISSLTTRQERWSSSSYRYEASSEWVNCWSWMKLVPVILISLRVGEMLLCGLSADRSRVKPKEIGSHLVLLSHRGALATSSLLLVLNQPWL